MSEVARFVCGQPLVWDAHNSTYHCGCDEPESARALQRLQEDALRYTGLVKLVLAEFAGRVWGAQEGWILSGAPKYHNREAVQKYAWAGAVRKSDYKFSPSREFISADDKYRVLLEDSHTFRVVAFEDYGYFVDNTSVSYLCLTEVSLHTNLSKRELQAGVLRLYGFLKNHPVPITTHGCEWPTELDANTAVSVGIELRKRILNKHS